MLRLSAFLTSLLFAVSASAQTWVQPQWGMNTAVNPYSVSIRLGTTFYGIGTMSAAGIWTPDIGSVVGTSGHKIPYLDAGNTWSAKQTFAVAPRYNALTGYVNCGGSLADCTASSTIGSDVITGVTTVSSASAGTLGEQISSANNTPVALTSATAANVTSILLTAGDWEVSGTVLFTPAVTTTVSVISASSSTTSATLPSTTLDANGHPTVLIAGSLATGTIQRLGISPYRVNVSTNTTVYLLGYSIFATSTMTATGVIRARRVR